MKKNHGFTLLEMSIVVAIIALIVGGIVGAKTMIRQAELRAVLTEYDAYLKATKEFIDKFQGLPGDIKTAETNWGADGAPCPVTTYTTTIPTDTVTCNGNGDGMIGKCNGDMFSGLAPDNTCADVGEIWRVWQHLRNATLLETRLTGRVGGIGLINQATPGLNVPSSRFVGGGWTLLHYINVANAAWIDGDHYGHVFLFGGGKGFVRVFTTQPILPTSDALDIDTKIDDGLPRTGIVRAWLNFWMTDNENDPGASATPSYCVDGSAYDLDDGTESEILHRCSLIFVPGF